MVIKKQSTSKNAIERILLAHGSGGRLTHELINSIFKKEFSNSILNALDDSATLDLPSSAEKRLAFTTDSFVVTPLFFPGGDIGKLSVCGTVNDLAMQGAQPLGLSVSFIIEEGLEISVLKEIASSISKAAREAGVSVVTGDTKVVEKGKADKLFITTSGVGLIAPGTSISGSNARPGDSVLINGNIGDHGISVLAARKEFKLNSDVESDCAPLNHLVKRMLWVSKNIHVLRDPTRGGLATTLNEIADASHVGIIIDEEQIPVGAGVRGVCSILGIDPLYAANEGKIISILPERSSTKMLKAMKLDRYGKNSAVIGKVVKSPRGVWVKTSAGGLRPLIMLEGEQLPRIC